MSIGSFVEIWQNRMLVPRPRRVGAPTSRKSWIRHRLELTWGAILSGQRRTLRLGQPTCWSGALAASSGSPTRSSRAHACLTSQITRLTNTSVIYGSSLCPTSPRSSTPTLSYLTLTRTSVISRSVTTWLCEPLWQICEREVFGSKSLYRNLLWISFCFTPVISYFLFVLRNFSIIL